jgi:hypothetical protein
VRASSPNFAQRLLFVVGALIVYRIGCFIPVPGVNPQAMLQLMQAQKGTIVDMFNMFSGGALRRFSLFALNVMPYISASIVIQLMTCRSSPAEGDAEGRRVRSPQDHPVLAHRRGVPGDLAGRQHRHRAAEPGRRQRACRWSTARAGLRPDRGGRR